MNHLQIIYALISMLIYTTFTHCVNSVRIRNYSGPHFPTFGLNTERYSESLSIQSKCGKMRNRIAPNTDTFYAVTFTLFMRIGLKTHRIDINAIKFKRSSYFTVSKCSTKVCTYFF